MITTACFLATVPDNNTVAAALPIGPYNDATNWTLSLPLNCAAGPNGQAAVYPDCMYGQSFYVDSASVWASDWPDNFDQAYYDDQCTPFGNTAVHILPSKPRPSTRSATAQARGQRPA